MGLFSNLKRKATSFGDNLYDDLGDIAESAGQKLAATADSVGQTLYAAGDIAKSGLDSVATGIAIAGSVGSDVVLTGARMIGDDVVDLGEVGLSAIGGYGGDAIANVTGLITDATALGLDVTELVKDLYATGWRVGGGAASLISPELSERLNDVADYIAEAGSLDTTADSLRDSADDIREAGDAFKAKGLALADDRKKDLGDTYAENARRQLLEFKERTDDSLELADRKITGERQSMADTWDAYVEFVGVDKTNMSKKERDENRERFHEAIRESRKNNPQASAADWAAAALTLVGGGQVARKGRQGGVGAAAAAAGQKLVNPSKLTKFTLDEMKRERSRKTGRR